VNSKADLNGKVVLAALVIATFASIVSPIVVAVLASRSKSEEWARQDEVARVLVAADKQKLDAQRMIDIKLETIHKLVNSNLTAALQSEYDARTAELVTLIELTDLKKAQGKQPTAATIDRIAATKAKLTELRITLDARATEQRIIDMQVRKAAEPVFPAQPAQR